MKLSDIKVKSLKAKEKPYRMSDGGGLYVQVSITGARLWRLAYRFNAKQKTLSIGQYPAVTLLEARKARDKAKALLAKGIDPGIEKKNVARASKLENDWRTVANEFYEKREQEGTQHATLVKLDWALRATYHQIGHMTVSDIKAPDILTLLREIEAKGSHEKAHRVRSTCSRVLRYAIATGRAERDVAADLRGALITPKVKHHAAIIDPVAVGGLMRTVKGFEGDFTTRTGLLFLAYTFLRPGEIRHFRWDDLDMGKCRLTIPAERMKMPRPHIVPLSNQVVTMLENIQPLTGQYDLILPSMRSKTRPLSENTFNAALRRCGYSSQEMTSHGFRTTASTLLNEHGWNADWIERQLAHVERNSVRSAYNAAEYLEDRTRMMQWWADHLDSLANTPAR